MVGLYYPEISWVDAVREHLPVWASIEGGAYMARTLTAGATTPVGSLLLPMYEGQPEGFRAALRSLRRQSGGVMLFDLVFVERYGWGGLLRPLTAGLPPQRGGHTGLSVPRQIAVDRVRAGPERHRQLLRLSRQDRCDLADRFLGRVVYEEGVLDGSGVCDIELHRARRHRDLLGLVGELKGLHLDYPRRGRCAPAGREREAHNQKSYC